MFAVVDPNNLRLTTWTDINTNFAGGTVEIHASTLNSTTELNYQRVSGKFWQNDIICQNDNIVDDDNCADQCRVRKYVCRFFLFYFFLNASFWQKS